MTATSNRRTQTFFMAGLLVVGLALSVADAAEPVNATALTKVRAEPRQWSFALRRGKRHLRRHGSVLYGWRFAVAVADGKQLLDLVADWSP